MINDIFIITSVINVGNISWSYFPQRSLFSPEERFNQTLESIRSIRKYSPNSVIILVEGGLLEESKLSIFKSMCDYVYYLGNNLDTKTICLLSNNKGLGDSWLILKGLEYIKNNNIIGRNIYKLSGRYIINENYNSNNISDTLPTFKRVNDNCYITFFFSVPYSLLNTYENNVKEVINRIKYSYECLEDILPNSFKNKHSLEIIGAEGLIAVDTSYKVYKV